jgi:hypothetical protein
MRFLSSNCFDEPWRIAILFGETTAGGLNKTTGSRHCWIILRREDCGDRQKQASSFLPVFAGFYSYVHWIPGPLRQP